MHSTRTNGSRGHGRRWGPLVAAVALPLVLVGSAIGWLQRPLPSGPSPAALRMEAYLAQAERRVVIVGNSLAVLDVDADQLADGLGLDRDAIAVLDTGYAKPPTFLALLDNRVFATGHRPELVLIVATPRQLLDVVPNSADQLEDLVAQMDEDDVVLREKVFGPGGRIGLADRLSGGRVAAREALLDDIRVGSTALVTASLSEAPAAADAAVAEVFGEASLGTERAPPVIAEPLPTSGLWVRKRADPRASFLPDLIASAHAHGARIVFVRPPLTRWMQQKEQLSPEDQAEVEAFLRAEGAGYLDFSELPVTQRDFMDLHHLAESGRRIVTTALVDALRSAGDGIPWHSVARERTHVEVRRVGEVFPARPLQIVRQNPRDPCRGAVRLPEAFADVSDGATTVQGLGRASPVVASQRGTPLLTHVRLRPGCQGAAEHQDRLLIVSGVPGTEVLADEVFDVGLEPGPHIRSDRDQETWWVYPGTALELAPADLPPGGEVRVVAVALGGGGGRAGITCGASRAPLVGRAERRTATCAPGDDPTIRVHSDKKGPWLVVRAVSWTKGDEVRWLIGDEQTAGPRRFDLVDSPGFTVGFQGAPAPVAYAGPRYDAGAVVFDVPGLDGLKWLSSRCTALRLYEDGEEVGVSDVNDFLQHWDGTFRYRPMDGSDPATNGHTYEPRLDPGRRCWERIWVYPGETVTARARVPYRIGAVDLGVKVYGDTPAGARLHVAVGVGEAEPVVTSLDIAALDADGYVTVALPEPMGGTSNPWVTFASDPGSPFLMMMHVHALEAVD